MKIPEIEQNHVQNFFKPIDKCTKLVKFHKKLPILDQACYLYTTIICSHIEMITCVNAVWEFYKVIFGIQLMNNRKIRVYWKFEMASVTETSACLQYGKVSPAKKEDNMENRVNSVNVMLMICEICKFVYGVITVCWHLSLRNN